MSALPVVSQATNPHFQSLGGREAVVRLVDAFYAAMDQRDDARAIRAMHGADLTHTKAVLVTYLVEWLGGPRQYSAERGAPRLGRVHQPFGIDGAARDAWLACMRQALDETQVDAGLATQLMAAFTKVADHLASHATSHTTPHATSHAMSHTPSHHHRSL